LRKFLPIPTNSRVFPTLSCINFRVDQRHLRDKHDESFV
jgi:hypothetical protein